MCYQVSRNRQLGINDIGVAAGERRLSENTGISDVHVYLRTPLLKQRDLELTES